MGLYCALPQQKRTANGPHLSLGDAARVPSERAHHQVFMDLTQFVPPVWNGLSLLGRAVVDLWRALSEKHSVACSISPLALA
eukprot:5684788-Amphidinium_carterae.1